nr:MAG: putative capsid polyprotein [Dicistroviridae sp.]
MDNKNISEEQVEITHFSSEGVIPTTVAVPDIVNLSPDYLSMTTREEREHNIKDFLSRPIVISTGLWSSSSPDETQLFTANFPEALIANQMYQDKLKGFVGLRATLVVKVQVNSQPFQQGRLMLQYIPYAQYLPNRVTMINSTLQGRSGCPRTDLDLSVGTEIEMRMPYVSPHVFYNLITGQGSFGAIYLVVYSSLKDQVSGTGSVEYTIWAHLEDVQIEYPTGANIFTGSSPNRSKLAQLALDPKSTPHQLYAMAQNAGRELSARIFAQSGVEQQLIKENSSPSIGVGQVAEGLNTLSKIPIVGNLFTKPAWISSQATNIFKMLGFAKPSASGAPCEAKLRSQNRMTNFDGIDTSHKMALSVDNEIETKSGMSGTSADEMELSHVLSIPNYWDRFKWDTTQLTGVSLWDNPVTPMKIKPFSDTVLNRFRCTHMGYVAQAFGLWRGSIVYTFKFVKTQYHSGRLQISFIPFYYNTTISTGVPDYSRTQKMIVDMRTSTEVSFTVPYVSSRPWMFVSRPEDAWLGTDGIYQYNAIPGIIRVSVLNQLVAANNVNQSIDVIVEVNGGKDLTFAEPTATSYAPYSGTLTAEVDQRSKKEHEIEYRIISAQAGNEVMGANQAVPRNLAQKGVQPQSIDMHLIDANWSPEAYCIGEKIMSIRQLIKRFALSQGASLTDPATANAIALAPFTFTSPVPIVGGYDYYSNLDYFSYLYAFWRGGVRYKVASTRIGGSPYVRADKLYVNMYAGLTYISDQIIALMASTKNRLLAVLLSTAVGITRNPSTLVVSSDIEGTTEFEVPYYNVSHISPVTINTVAPAIKSIECLKGTYPPVVVTMSTPNPHSDTDALSFSVYRAAADDFSLSYIVGVPPLVLMNPTTP